MDKEKWEEHLKKLREEKLPKKRQMQKIHKHKSVLKKSVKRKDKNSKE